MTMTTTTLAIGLLQLLASVGVRAAPTASSSSYGNSTSTAPYGSSTSDDSLPAVVPANPRHDDEALIEALELAPTTQKRINLLNQPGDFIFDFNNPPNTSITQGLGGHTVKADAATFPAVIGNGVSMTLGFLKGCGLNTPHVHNRATEFNIVVEGRLVTNFQVENGVEPWSGLLSQFQATVFPQGAIHTEFNPDCEDAVFVAGFNNVDPGVEQIAQTFFNLRPDIISATLGGTSYISGDDIESFKDMLPANVVNGVESCLKKCNIPKKAKRDVLEF
ncbi:RmlC-like cupin domain-containing protein [Xylariales sp. PMI_506]|nr:RmlC-like cupin domain-containing protein [Xylariales sp. PMI_506]